MHHVWNGSHWLTLWSSTRQCKNLKKESTKTIGRGVHFGTEVYTADSTIIYRILWPS